MERTIYLILGLTGSAILLLQVLLQVFGLAGEGDLDGGHEAGQLGHGTADSGAGSHDGSWFFGVLSLKALVAFAGLFGLTGLALLEAGWEPLPRALVASLAGIGGMFVVAFLMRGLSRLTVSGTVDLRNAVGTQGSVYLHVPARGGGAGKVTVEIQGRTLELRALTDGEALPTGAQVQVVSLVGDDTVKVVAA